MRQLIVSIRPSEVEMSTARLHKLMETSVPRAVVLIRLSVGGVFLTEGIQKFLFPAQVGVGRFAEIPIPMPDILAPFVATVEIVCGTLILSGLLTRLAEFLLWV